jgi:uncharacterized protein (TIGR03437 family)
MFVRLILLASAASLLPLRLYSAEPTHLRLADQTVRVINAGDAVEIPLAPVSTHTLSAVEELRLDAGLSTTGVLLGLTDDRKAVRVSTSRLLSPGPRRVPYSFRDGRGASYRGEVELNVVAANPLPRSTRIPVILLNGWQLNCSNSSLPGTFGNLATWLNAQGVSTVFFDNCTVGGSPSIEQLGDHLGELIASLRYSDGSPVPQVDVISHSMGGLIARSYLAGKRHNEARFTPPLNPRVRKLITIATPHFGALECSGVQAAQMCRGSKFLSDLATWNLGFDDLRGVDYLSVVGNFAATAGLAGASDGLITVTSASGGSFPGVADDRTRVVPYCHIKPGLLESFVVDCPIGTRGIANIDAADHLTWQVVERFLRDDATWRNYGTSLDRDPVLSRTGALYFSMANNQNVTYSGLSQFWFAPDGAQSLRLSNGPNANAFRDFLPTGQGFAYATFTDGDFGASVSIVKGGTIVRRPKFGPTISFVAPATNHVAGLTRAPRMLVSIYGADLTDPGQFAATGLPLPTALGGTTVSLSGIPLRLVYASPTQINAVLPDAPPVHGPLTVTRSAGTHSIGLMVEDSVSSLFTTNGAGTGALAAQRSDYTSISPTNPARRGDVVIVYGTGLGTKAPQVTATVGLVPAPVLYAGAAPGFPGLDQFNIRIPSGAPEGNTVGVQVTVGSQRSNIGFIAVRP